LLDLQAIPLDNTLRTLTEGVSDSTVTLVDEAGRAQRCELDRREGILSGPGLKGFFSRYRGGLLGVEPLGDGAFRIVHLPLLGNGPNPRPKKGDEEGDGEI